MPGIGLSGLVSLPSFPIPVIRRTPFTDGDFGKFPRLGPYMDSFGPLRPHNLRRAY